MYTTTTCLILAWEIDSYNALLLCQYNIIQVVTSIKTMPENNFQVERSVWNFKQFHDISNSQMKHLYHCIS